MDNKISREFHFGSLLRFSLPTIAMMLMMSLYSMVDGIFVSQFVGTNAFSSINIIIPVTFAVLGVGIMLGTGGSAVIARKLGEKKEKEARQDFSLLMLFGVVLSVVLAVLGLLFRDPLIRILGANDTLMADCRVYFTILAAGFPAYMLQIMFQSYFVTAGRPHLGLWATVGAGLLNAVLDYLFIVPLGMGVAGAALATVAGYCVPAVIGLNFFFRKKGNLYFVRPVRNWGTLLRSCANGSSEMVTNIASSVISILFNLIMIRSYGADGVAAIRAISAHGDFSRFFRGCGSCRQLQLRSAEQGAAQTGGPYLPDSYPGLLCDDTGRCAVVRAGPGRYFCGEGYLSLSHRAARLLPFLAELFVLWAEYLRLVPVYRTFQREGIGAYLLFAHLRFYSSRTAGFTGVCGSGRRVAGRPHRGSPVCGAVRYLPAEGEKTVWLRLSNPETNRAGWIQRLLREQAFINIPVICGVSGKN